MTEPVWTSHPAVLSFLDDEYEDQPPSYGTPGRILVRVRKPDGDTYKWDYEVLDYDNDSGVFWINEGTGFDYWFDQYDLFTKPGLYVIENISGSYIKGDWGFTDDDEEWDFGIVRKATWREWWYKCLM